MKYINFLILITSFFFQMSFSKAQKQDSMSVCFDKYWNYVSSRKLSWTINGVKIKVFHHLPNPYKVLSDTIKIPIHEAGFDTIVFKNHYNDSLSIITKFTKNELYVISYIEYSNFFDIENAKFPIFSTEEDMIRNQGQVSFKITNSYPYDKFICSFGTEGSYIQGGIKLYQNEQSEYVTSKSYPFHLQSIFTIGVFKVKDITEYFPATMKKYSSIFLVEPEIEYNVEKQNIFFYRFFQQEKLLVTYDSKMDKLKIEIQDK